MFQSRDPPNGVDFDENAITTHIIYMQFLRESMEHSNSAVNKKINYFEVTFHMYMITYMPQTYHENHAYAEPMICHMYRSHIQHNFRQVKYDIKKGSLVITQLHDQDNVKCTVLTQ